MIRTRGVGVVGPLGKRRVLGVKIGTDRQRPRRPTNNGSRTPQRDDDLAPVR